MREAGLVENAGRGTVEAERPAGAVRLLLVEDDEVIGEATKLNLERHGYAVTWVTDGLTALTRFSHAEAADTDEPGYDIVLSDVMLPELDGITLCRRIRQTSSTSLVLISARTDNLDVVTGLEAGADDYVVKPFDLQVLLARLRSVARRSERPTPGPEAGDHDELEQFGDLTLDRRAFELRRGDEAIGLTPTEMRLFLELADAPGVVLSRATLLSRVWDYEWEEDSHVVNVHIQRLRAKVGADRIETVRGFGYKLRR